MDCREAGPQAEFCRLKKARPGAQPGHMTRIEPDHYLLCPEKPRLLVGHKPPTIHTLTWSCHSQPELISRLVYMPGRAVNSPPGVGAVRVPCEPEGHEVWWSRVGLTWSDFF